MSGSDSRPRTIVTTDPELDDLNSLIRLLLYSNEIEIQGLIYASSCFHWRGDGKGTPFFHADRAYSQPQTSWRWGPAEDFIHEVVDRYAEVQDNLRAHDPAYPSAEELRAVIRVGNIDFEGDDLTPSAGADLIVERMLDDDRRPLHVQLWAGPSTLARALRTLEERFSGDPEWPAIRERLSRRVIVTTFWFQDDSYEEYIRPHWPDIEVRDVASRTWGYGARATATPEGRTYLSAEWTRANVSARGPLGALYRVWGDGRAMLGDHLDHFGSAKTEAQLHAEGIPLFTPLQEAGSWISEGDSTNFLNLIGNGLRAHERAHFGGWGGRQLPNPVHPNEHLAALAEDHDDQGETPPLYATARWFADAQRDFAARLEWSTTPDFASVNHAPVVDLLSPAFVRAPAGGSVEVSASVFDPDGDAVRVRWREDIDAGPGRPSGAFEDEERPRTRFALAPDLTAGSEVHLLLEARDDGHPSLARYARVVVSVE